MLVFNDLQNEVRDLFFLFLSLLHGNERNLLSPISIKLIFSFIAFIQFIIAVTASENITRVHLG